MAANVCGGQNRLAQTSVIEYKERYRENRDYQPDQCDTKPIPNLIIGN